MPIRLVDKRRIVMLTQRRAGRINMKEENKRGQSPAVRLLRMRRMFAIGGAILLDDYEYFTKQDEPTPLNKAPRKLAKRHGRPSPKRN